MTHEAENLLQFGQDFGRDPRVVFPIPVLELCRPNIIIETFETGLPLSTVVNQLDEMPTASRVAVANAGVDMLLKMVRLFLPWACQCVVDFLKGLSTEIVVVT